MWGPGRLHWPHAHEIGHDLERGRGGYLVLKNIFVINVMALGYIFGMDGKNGTRGRNAGEELCVTMEVCCLDLPPRTLLFSYKMCG